MTHMPKIVAGDRVYWKSIGLVSVLSGIVEKGPVYAHGKRKWLVVRDGQKHGRWRNEETLITLPDYK